MPSAVNRKICRFSLAMPSLSVLLNKSVLTSDINCPAPYKTSLYLAWLNFICHRLFLIKLTANVLLVILDVPLIISISTCSISLLRALFISNTGTTISCKLAPHVQNDCLHPECVSD